MKRILFKLLALLVGKFLARRFGHTRHRGYDARYYDQDPYSQGYPPYQGGFFQPYKYRRKKSKFRRLMDWLD
jgi:hypothetical protein